MRSEMDNLKPTIKALKDMSNEAIVEMEKMKVSTNIPEMCKFYKELTEGIELIDTLVKSLKEIEDELSAKTLPDLLEATGVDSIKVHNRQFVLTGRLFANMTQEMQPKGIPWVKSIGYGAIIKEGVNSSTLTTAIKEWMDHTGMVPPEEAVRIFIKKGISVRKVKK